MEGCLLGVVKPVKEAWTAANEQLRSVAEDRLSEAIAQVIAAAFGEIRLRLRECTELRDEVVFCGTELAEIRGKQRQLESRGLGPVAREMGAGADRLATRVGMPRKEPPYVKRRDPRLPFAFAQAEATLAELAASVASVKEAVAFCERTAGQFQKGAPTCLMRPFHFRCLRTPHAHSLQAAAGCCHRR